MITPDKDKDEKEAQLIVNQIDWRKAKKEKIHRIYDESRGQFDRGNLGQIAWGTVLPEAWLPDQIARGQFWLRWTSLIF